MSTIHKKGSREECDNYRGTSVQRSMARVYGKILTKKNEKEYSDFESEEQAGFRAGRSTVDHLFCFIQVIEKKTAFQAGNTLTICGPKKAYDNIPQSEVWEALERTNINVNLIKAIKNLYKDNTTRMKIAKRF